MDLIDKLKYYSDSSKPKQDRQKNSDLNELALKLNGIVFEENSLPIIKREVNFSFNQMQLDELFQDEIKLSVLTKGDFSDSINIHDILFFDLETTGLAGGAGTYPFLIGIAFFEKDSFNVIQYFLPEYDRDVFAYIDIKKYIRNTSILGSFNGKSYDYPLLKNRFILNRFEDIFIKFDHIDLLHLSRRIWKNSLDNCSLGNIEQQIFKFSRFKDIEGYLIPLTYFDYLQSGKYDDIVNIILHNEQDLVSLGRLIFHLSEIENEESHINDAEILSLFDTSIKSNVLDKSNFYFELIKKRNVSIPTKTLLLYSLLLKRYNEWETCLKIWEKLTKSENFALPAFEELAKYHEHKVKDINKAKEYTVRALEYLKILAELEVIHTTTKEDFNQFQYRLNRINFKLDKK